MIAVLIIPTGIGCEIGGHAGDANPVAKLIGSCCDKLILHPNVVNASDINEMPPNALYVEGSMLDRFLEGKICLKEVSSNKILVAVNPPIHNETINAVSAARATVGIDASIIVLKTPLRLIATITSDGASGEVYGNDELVEQVRQYDFDALALATPIEVSEDLTDNYWKSGGVNPWGGVEAKASKLICTALNKPVAHAPVMMSEDSPFKLDDWNFVADSRMAAEVISWAFLHCVLKGLHTAPRIGVGISVGDVDVMVSPYGCYGKPHRACQDAKVPIIVVKENTCIHKQWEVRDAIYVDNYWEAAGLLMCMQAGIDKRSVRRPLDKTTIHSNE